MAQKDAYIGDEAQSREVFLLCHIQSSTASLLPGITWKRSGTTLFITSSESHLKITKHFYLKLP